MWLWIALHNSMELWGDENNILLQVDYDKTHMIICQEDNIHDHE